MIGGSRPACDVAPRRPGQQIRAEHQAWRALSQDEGARGYPVSSLHQGVTAANLQITPVFVVRTGEDILVLRPFAPDGSVPVGWCRGQGFFEDPVTGSKRG